MTTMIDLTKGGIIGSLLNDPFELRKEPEGNMTEEKHFPVDSTSMMTSPTTGLFKDLDPAMRKMFMKARLSEEDLKDKDVAEAVDYIINQFGGLKAVQRELKRRGPVSQTLPRAASASISLTLQKGPLPPVPTIKNYTTSQQASHGNATLKKTPLNPWMSSHSSAPAPERKRKSESNSSRKR
ncbi:actin nucleation-promoting factor WASL-like isoform X2 [Cololabis saira]|uniref:actin nucleation-promoting factor WASL-like isoform X2 n=1 Tax=Cololabis saira TaxID=129043 RepID=UPI002AD45C41|nr:actin nucleation-promoting factor WASL-like isoform X2 [Cololabis saira]